MGMNSQDSFRLVCDIETAPLPNVSQWIDWTTIEAPANYKDEAKIAAFKAEKQAEMFNKAALDVDLCRVVAVGFMREDHEEPRVYHMGQFPEDDLLLGFWGELGQRATIGYNSCGFDLPVLLRRSLYLNVQTPIVNLDKYRTNHLDLQQKLSLNGLLKYRSLDWYCKRFGLDVPKDDTTGKDIGQLVSDGNWTAIAAHCRSDVLKTAALARRMGLISQPSAEMVF